MSNDRVEHSCHVHAARVHAACEESSHDGLLRQGHTSTVPGVAAPAARGPALVCGAERSEWLAFPLNRFARWSFKKAAPTCRG